MNNLGSEGIEKLSQCSNLSNLVYLDLRDNNLNENDDKNKLKEYLKLHLTKLNFQEIIL